MYDDVLVDGRISAKFNLLLASPGKGENAERPVYVMSVL
jgi:hypothetical protein